MLPPATTPSVPLRLVCFSRDPDVEDTLRDALRTLGPDTILLDRTDPAAPDPDLLAQADGLLCAGPQDARRAAQAAPLPRLRWVQFWGDKPGDGAAVVALDGRFTVCAAPAELRAASCAEHVLALMLAFARGLPAAFAAQQDRDQDAHARIAPALFSLEGKTVGIVGAGRVGQAVGTRCQAFGMQTVGLRRHDLSGPTPGINVLLSHLRYHDLILASDVVVLALPLTPETRLMFGEEEIEIIKKSAHVINVGRRGLVDEPWLARALQNRWIAGAGLDILSDEPLPPDSPFWGLPNCIVTPHPGGVAAPVYWPRFARFVALQAARLLRGEALQGQAEPPAPG